MDSFDLSVFALKTNTGSLNLGQKRETFRVAITTSLTSSAKFLLTESADDTEVAQA